MFGRLVSSVSPHIPAGQSLSGAQSVLRVVVTQTGKMSYSSGTEGIEIKGGIDDPTFKEILTTDALSFVAKLHRTFNPTRLRLLKAREDRAKALASGSKKLDFLEVTQEIRENDNWKISSLPSDLEQRRVEITGPPTQKMIINAMNSGADAYMCDFEDSNSPTWKNQIAGQVYIRDAIRRQLQFTDKGKEYKLNDKVATLSVRPRGWHLPEKHITVDGSVTSGSLVDFGLFFYHNARELLNRGTGPYFYLPKLESHLEARLWNDVFVWAQKELGISEGTIKATVLVETLPAAFEMEEILYVLQKHSAGLNAGRWDYIFSCIKCNAHNKDLVLADRSHITMTAPFMRAYALSLIRACHRREAPAIGGMSALIPIKDNPEENARAMEGVRSDKQRDAEDGFDGGWVAHPGLVDLALKEFEHVLGQHKNQIFKKREDVKVSAQDLQNFAPREPITRTGLKNNVSVGVRYLGAWLAGNGCVPLYNLMEDAATAEISRTQVWQWLHSPNGVLHDEGNKKITPEILDQMIGEELEALKGAPGYNYYEQSSRIFASLAKSERLEPFLTNPLYDRFGAKESIRIIGREPNVPFYDNNIGRIKGHAFFMPPINGRF